MFHPTNASWANLIEAHFGSLRQFTLANSQHPNHTAKTRALHAYLRWRNANARHPATPTSSPPNAATSPHAQRKKASVGAADCETGLRPSEVTAHQPTTAVTSLATGRDQIGEPLDLRRLSCQESHCAEQVVQSSCVPLAGAGKRDDI